MHYEFLAHSPLLILPLVAMFLFISVWLVATARAMTRSPADMAAAARLPLEDEGACLAPSARAAGRPS